MQFGAKLVIMGALLGSVGLSMGLYTLAADYSIVVAAAPKGNNVQSSIIEQNASQAELAADCQVSSHFPANVLRWCGLITQHASMKKLSPDLIAAVILQESGGSPQAYSHSGAVGLMQVMPRDGLAASFHCKNGPCFANRPTIKQLEDPAFNIAYGTEMLSNLVARNGNIRDALKSYGPMDVGYSYADKVLAHYQRLGN